MPTPPMSRDEVDRAIVGLVAAYDRISAAMYELDAHPARAVLGGGGLRGRTERVAGDVLATVDALWSQFAALGTRLEQARAVRAERSRPGEAELRRITALLREPALGLGAAGTVLDDAVAGACVTWRSVPELAGDLETSAAAVVRTLGEVQEASTRVAGWYAATERELDRVRESGRDLGGDASAPSDVDALAVRLARAQAEALRDPLDAAGPAPALLTEIAALATRIAGWVELREAYPDRMGRLAAAVDEVAALEADAARVHGLASAKIANSALPPAPRSAAGLRAHLAQLAQLHREGRWRRLADELSVVDRSVAAAAERARFVHEAADGLLLRRQELRGRLDAYRAVAGKLGLIEHDGLAQRYRAARDLLYTSPCDLAAATRAVVAYQRYLKEIAEWRRP